MTKPSDQAFPLSVSLSERKIDGLTKREWFAGQFAASGGYTIEGCVALADDLILSLNESEGK